MNNRRFYSLAVVITMLAPELLLAQGPDAGYAAADIRVMAPGVVYNAGLLDLAAAYTKETGKKVGVTLVGMGRIVNTVKTDNPPADVIMLPLELMSTLALDGGVVPGTFWPLGRSEMGLAVRAGAPHPDISTVDKLAAALRSAKAVMRSNPAGSSMVAKVIEDNVIKRPEFTGVNSPVSSQGEGGQAMARGEGDMALQAICEILPRNRARPPSTARSRGTDVHAEKALRAAGLRLIRPPGTRPRSKHFAPAKRLWARNTQAIP